MAQDWKDMLASLASGAGADGDNEINGENNAPETSEAHTPQSPLHIVIDRKGRKGKVATIIEGFALPDEEVEKLASELKRKIGTGGSSRGGEILLQGEWKDKAASLLKEKGFKLKC